MALLTSLCTQGMDAEIVALTNIKPRGRTDVNLEIAIRYMLENFGEEITLDDIALDLGFSKFSLSRKFNKDFGMSPMRWLWMFRCLLAAEFFAVAPDLSIKEVGFSSGFNSSAHFSRFFSSFFGKTPTEYKQACLEQSMDAAKKSQPCEQSRQGAMRFKNHDEILRLAIRGAIRTLKNKVVNE